VTHGDRGRHAGAGRAITPGQNKSFCVFAAAVIGAISLNGGKGRLGRVRTGIIGNDMSHDRD
jgi:ribose/xylose/arabinose/galactoside ABC-type transport system permease subunit